MTTIAEQVAPVTDVPAPAPSTDGDDGWQPIETAPTDTSVLVWIPGADHFGPPIYRAIFVDKRTGRRCFTTALAVSRGCSADAQPTHWRPLPAPPST